MTLVTYELVKPLGHSFENRPDEGGGRRRKEGRKEGGGWTFLFPVNLVTRDHQQLVLPDVLPPQVDRKGAYQLSETLI